VTGKLCIDNKVSRADLAKRGVVERGDKRGTYRLEASLSGDKRQVTEPHG
jgi:hypothetical protein